MRKVIFTINDLEWFKKYYKLSENQFKNIFEDQKPFKCTYILYGRDSNVDRYELTDYDENKININNLNGYQRGVVLGDCLSYFMGGKYHSDTKEPCGALEIKEESVED